MKMIEKITLTVYSTLMLIISVIACLLVFGWIDSTYVQSFLNTLLSSETNTNIVLGISVLFILLSIRCIFFTSSDKQEEELKNGILLENSEGKLLITKETIENLVSGIVRGFDSAQEVSTKIELDSENHVIVLINLRVKENAIIKELTTNLQTKVKEAIKKSTDLDVKEVNIKVKNIEPAKGITQE